MRKQASKQASKLTSTNKNIIKKSQEIKSPGSFCFLRDEKESSNNSTNKNKKLDLDTEFKRLEEIGWL